MKSFISVTALFLILGVFGFYYGCGLSGPTQKQINPNNIALNGIYYIEGSTTRYTFSDLLELEKQGKISERTVLLYYSAPRNSSIYMDTPPTPDPTPPPPPPPPPDQVVGETERITWAELKRRFK